MPGTGVVENPLIVVGPECLAGIVAARMTLPVTLVKGLKSAFTAGVVAVAIPSRHVPSIRQGS
jgi:hypothetical protein